MYIREILQKMSGEKRRKKEIEEDKKEKAIEEKKEKDFKESCFFFSDSTFIVVPKNENTYKEVFDRRSHVKNYQYKIKGFDVYERLLEEKNYNGYDVKDGFVLDDEIIERKRKEHNRIYGENINMDDIKRTEEYLREFVYEDIKTLKESCEWHKIEKHGTSIGNRGPIKYFILYRNVDIISKQEFKKFMKNELEKITLLYLEAKNLCKKHKVKFEFEQFKFDDEMLKKDIDKFIEELTILCEQLDINTYDIRDLKDIIETVNGYLNEDK